MKKILLIEDSADIVELVKDGLEGYSIQQANTLADARAALRQAYFDLLLIDVSLPDGSGFDLCLELGRDLKYRSVPKLLVTANGEISDKVYGFACGASDYITKPFHLLELKARVDRYLNTDKTRADNGDGDVVYACFAFNLSFQKCYLILDGDRRKDLRLTPTEFRLFHVLVKSEGQALSRAELERAAWESHGTFIQARGIDTHIAHLRKKLGSLGRMIVSVYGHGYAFQSRASGGAIAA